MILFSMSLLPFRARLRFFHNNWTYFQKQWTVIFAKFQSFSIRMTLQTVTNTFTFAPIFQTSFSSWFVLKMLFWAFEPTDQKLMFISRKLSVSSTDIVCWSVVTLKGLNFQAEKSKNPKLFSPPTWLSPWMMNSSSRQI